MLNPLNMIQGVSMGLSLVAGLINKIDRSVNSSEHNFKKDLHGLLKATIGEQTANKIKDFLNTGNDQGIGDRLRALMSSGLIPSSMVPQIAQLAGQNGVPQSSVDQNALRRPMDASEVARTIGEDRARKLGLSDFYKDAMANHEIGRAAYKELLLQKMRPN
jgi:hypothetical protein